MVGRMTESHGGEKRIGRYVLHDEIASGGMATVYFGRQLGHIGFSRTVAMKRMHESYAKDEEFISMFIDEVRIVGRIRHPNVVPVLDLVAQQGELLMVMEYVHGETLARLIRTANLRKERLPVRVAASIMTGVLEGLHAAHEAVSEKGDPLHIVHRDVSPQNIIVGVDGVARVLDFGVALAAGRLQTTRDGQVKGKMAYMAPEQMRGSLVDRRTDVYAVGVVLWEVLTGTRLFQADNEIALFGKVLNGETEPPSSAALGISKSLDAVVMRAIDGDPSKRFQTAQEMALEIERATGITTARQVGQTVEKYAGDALKVRAARVTEIEGVSSTFTRKFRASDVDAPGPDSEAPKASKATDDIPTLAPPKQRESETEPALPASVPDDPESLVGDVDTFDSAPQAHRKRRNLVIVAAALLAAAMLLLLAAASQLGTVSRPADAPSASSGATVSASIPTTTATHVVAAEAKEEPIDSGTATASDSAPPDPSSSPAVPSSTPSVVPPQPTLRTPRTTDPNYYDPYAHQ
jgi:serine/threonine-protein kinase